MSKNVQYQTDKMLQDLFSTMKLDSPSSDFTDRVMARISPEFANEQVSEPEAVSSRIWLAILFSVLFFSLLFFTSDIPAFDFLNRFLDFRWFTDFTLSDRLAHFLQKVWIGFDSVRVSYVVIPFTVLLGWVGIDLLVNRKTGSSAFFPVL